MKLGVQYRSAVIDRASVDAENRTVRFSFSSETPVERWFGAEILDHNPGSVRLERLRDGGPLLCEHDPEDMVGVVESADITEGRGYATVRFSKSEDGQSMLDDVRDGIRRNVSVGYRVHRMVLESEQGDRKSYRITDWEPLEVSLVSIPADSSVGVGRAEQTGEQHEVQIERRNMADDKTPSASSAAVVDEKDILSRERKRAETIRLMGENLKCTEEANKAIANGIGVDEFRSWFVDQELPRRGKQATLAPSLGEFERDGKAKYSLMRVLQKRAIGKDVDGFEGEVATELRKLTKRDTEGFLIPCEVAGIHRRTMTANVGSAGGYAVSTDILGAEFISKLDIAPTVEKAGARRLAGLVGDVAIVKQTGGATGYWLGENTSITASQLTLSRLLMTPHRLGVRTALSKQLLAQSSLDVEALVREDQAKRFAIAIDLAALQGSGNNGEPKGLFSFDTTNSGINTVTYSAAATFGKTRDQIASIMADNVMGSPTFLVDPATWGKWSQKSVDTGSGVFIWTGTDQNGTVGGYRGMVSNNLPSSKSICGVFSEMLLGFWDGVDLVVDPYTAAATGEIYVTMTVFTDVLVRYPEAFCVSTDSAAQ